MQRISGSCLDHIRGWLTFTEIHSSRTVAKRWSEVKDVEKVVELGGEHFFGFTANFDKVTSLTANEVVDRYTAMMFIYRVISQNIHTLKFLHLDWCGNEEAEMRRFVEALPTLPMLKKLSIFGDCLERGTNSWKYSESIIYYCPNIEELLISYTTDPPESLDFSKLRKLRCVELKGSSTPLIKLQNCSMGIFTTLVYSPLHRTADRATYADQTLRIWIKSFPNVSIILQKTIALSDDFALKKCIWNKNELVIKDLHFRLCTTFHLRDMALKLKAMVNPMRLMRGDFNIKCNLEGNVMEMKKLGASALSLIIAKMKEMLWK